MTTIESTLSNEEEIRIPKNEDRILEIRCPMTLNIQYELKTSKFARYINRDFYLMSTMFFTTSKRNTQYKDDVLVAIEELKNQIEPLKKRCEPYTYLLSQSGQLKTQRFSVYVVHPICSEILRILKISDGYYSSLYLAEFAGLIDREQRFLLVRDFLITYERLHRIMLKMAHKTAEELFKEVETDFN